MNYYKIISHCRNKKLRNLILTYAIKKEGGYPYSTTIRCYFRDNYNVKVGYGSYGCFDFSHLRPNIAIGNYCSFGPGVRVFRANHKMELFTTHPIAYGALGGKNKIDSLVQKELIIGNDVWIGANAMILPGCSFIGDGAVIGAGSIVTKDIEPYTIVAGNPAKILRKRFPIDVQKRIQETKWWEKMKDELSDSLLDYQQLIDNER